MWKNVGLHWILLAAASSALFLVCALTGCESRDPVETARALQNAGKFHESLQILREFLDEESSSPQALFLYGRALRNTGQPQKAVWALREAAEDPDWMVAANVALASSLMSALDWSGAVEATNRVLEEDPENAIALVQRGQARSQGKLDEEAALEDFDRALELEPENLRVQLFRISSLIELERVDEAGKAIAEIEERGKEFYAGIEVLGKLCTIRASFASATGDLDAAQRLFTECLERYPANATLLDETTQYFDQRGEAQRASQALEAALEASPGNTAYRARLAERLREAGDRQGSEALLRAGLEIGDADQRADAWAALADHFMEIGDESAAADAFEQSYALREDPGALEALKLADVAARAGRNRRALEIAKDMADDTHRGLIQAIVHLNEGRPGLALTRLDEVQVNWPDNPGARYYTARAAEQVGNFERAIHEYRQAIRSGPGFTDAGLRLARLHEAESKRNQAWVIGIQYFNVRPDDPEIATLLLRLGDYLEEPDPVRRLLRQLRSRPTWALALALRSDRIEKGSGPAHAINSLLHAPGIDLARPEDAAALRALVPRLVAAERAEEAETLVAAALSSHPDAADFHEIHGQFLEASGAPASEAYSAYSRAVELDPEQARALASLGRLSAAAGDPDAALSYFDRASEANPHDREPLRESAALAARTGRAKEAKERLQALLREHPYDTESALELSRLALADSKNNPRALELAQRARRFGGGESARELLARIHRERGEPELAARYESSAEEARDESP